uniref:Cytochrome P450 n=1 Tax=Panagrolaimus sp. PS1159 TaxID=55785 RepID=A0AC35EXM7_9BILA
MIWYILFTIFIVFIFHQCYWRRRNYPPGPFPWPIIGNILMINPNLFDQQLLKLKKQYGKVITIWLPVPMIVISDAQVLKDTMIKQGDKFAGRPHSNLMVEFIGGNYGLIFSDNSFWREQKRFALKVLRDFGFGKPILEQTIIDQAQAVCDRLKAMNEEPVDLTKLLTIAVGNVIFQLSFNKTEDFDDDLVFNFRNEMLEIAAIFCHPFAFLLELFPKLKFLDPLFGGVYQRALNLNNNVMNMMREHISEHRKTINYDEEPQDYIDAFLIEQKKQNPEMKLHGEWSDLQLLGAIYDLFGAGMETTSTSIRTFILYMVRNPDIQKQCHEEIDKIIGRDRTITMADQINLSYISACIHELQRIAIILTLNLPHITTEDAEIDGYFIPKGTQVIPQFQSVHLDSDIFSEPEKFDPTRFLDSDGKFRKDDRVTPFSLGKRACLGESLARMELFLFCATFLQHFEFLPEEDNIIPPLDYQFGVLKAPLPFKVRACRKLFI